MDLSRAFLLAVFCGFHAIALAEPMTVWLTLDDEKIGPALLCEGELSVDGGKLALREWMQEGEDAVNAAGFRITTEHDAKTAEAARLKKAYRTTLPKGILLEIDSHAQTTLRGKTNLGEFEIALDRLRREEAVTMLDDKLRLQRAPAVKRHTGDKAEEEYPSIAVLPDGRTALAFVAWDGTADTVWLQRGDELQPLTEKPGDYLDPRCAVDADGNLRVVWAAGEAGQWDLWAWNQGKTQRLTSNPQNDFWPRLARDPRGRIWVAWQSVAENRHYEVMLAELKPDGLSPALSVSDHAADDWEPALCATPDGRIVVAWDTYRNGSYDVYLRQFKAETGGMLEPLGPPQPVAATARREAHASLAADADNRVWIAWDVGLENWGKHPKGGATLHSWRHADVACFAAGQLQRPAAGLMDALPEAWRTFVEYPHLAVDGKGHIWLLFRLENQVHAFYTPPGLRAQSYGTWHWFATQYDGRRWSTPLLLAQSNGRQDMRPDAACTGDGEPLVAFAADGRTRRFPYVPVDHDVFTVSLAGFGTAARAMQLVAAEDLGRVAPVDPDPELLPLPRTWSVGGKDYRLVIGDTHRHTDISRCTNGRDGSLRDAYRYALNTCGLDWLAVSDHDQDLLKHRNDRIQRPRQDYDWWRSQKYCDLYTIPGRFLAIYGYEHGGGYKDRGGHKNVLLAKRGYPVVEDDAPADLFARLAGTGAVAIPHQLADGGSRTDWTKWSPEYEPVAEIFQMRGSYEYEDCPRVAKIFTAGNSLWDALARDVRIGIVASSDHGQTHQARAAAYVRDVPGGSADLAGCPGFTREGILESLRARRTFGATTATALQVSIDGQPMGVEFTADKAATLEVAVSASVPIRAVAVVRDNRFVYTTEPKTNQARFTFHDMDSRPGQSSYYYVRALIEDDNVAWSSPLWIKRKPAQAGNPRYEPARRRIGRVAGRRRSAVVPAGKGTPLLHRRRVANQRPCAKPGVRGECAPARSFRRRGRSPAAGIMVDPS
ncbi:MAG: hypothetical protein HUU20_26820 [Pirellulales bacterium]|nr:hypothetical protein [Pirellulales bacterium]